MSDQAAKELQEMLDNPQKVKVRVTTYLDGDLVKELKRLAASGSKKYQSLLNEKLREVLFGKEEDSKQDLIFQQLRLINKSLKVIESNTKPPKAKPANNYHRAIAAARKAHGVKATKKPQAKLARVVASRSTQKQPKIQRATKKVSG